MENRSREARYLLLIVALLITVFGATAWFLYNLANTVSNSRPKSPQALIYTQSAVVQARQALSGDDRAWDALQATGTVLERLPTTDLTEDEKRDLDRVRNNVTTVLNGRGDSDSVRRIVGRLGELVPAFTRGVRELETDRALQKNPLILAELERLIVLAESVQLLTRQPCRKGRGTPTAGVRW